MTAQGSPGPARRLLALRRIAAEGVRARRPSERIVDDLVDQGAAPEEALRLWREAFGEHEADMARRASAIRALALGAVLFVAGAGLTIWSLSTAVEGGSRIAFVWYGAVGAGLALIGRGFALLQRPARRRGVSR